MSELLPPESAYPAIGLRIRLARQKARLTQGELSKRLSKPRTYAAISDIERGRTRLNVDGLLDVARACGCLLTDLLPVEVARWEHDGAIDTQLAAYKNECGRLRDYMFAITGAWLTNGDTDDPIEKASDYLTSLLDKALEAQP